MSANTNATTRNKTMHTPLSSSTVRALALALCLIPATAWAGDFIDTRVTFTIGDDNFLRSAGEQNPDSPLFGIGDRPGYELPTDNLDSATSGRENEMHLVLYKKVDGIFPGLTTEVAAALEINLAELEARDPKLYEVFSDDSSYIRLSYAIDADKRGDKFVDLVMFPLSGDRFRAGYLYDLTWGGKNMFRKRKGPTPAFKLGGNHGKFYWWGGMKFVLAPTVPEEYTSLQNTKSTTTQWETLYGVLAGAGVQPISGLSIDLSGGYLQVANNPVKEVPDLVVSSTGFSARMAYGRGMRIHLSADLRLLRNDPEYLERFSRRPTYNPGGGMAWSVAVEGTAVAQVLADTDSYGASKVQWAPAAALNFKLQHNHLRAVFTGMYKSVAFGLLDQPSLPSYRAFPDEAITEPSMAFAFNADYHFPSLLLTPGIQAGIEFPGAMKTQLTETVVGSNPSSSLTGEQTIIFPNFGGWVLLPEGKDRLPVYSVRLTADWWASEILTLQAFVLFIYDNNASIQVTTADGHHKRIFDEPVKFGAGLTAQARF